MGQTRTGECGLGDPKCPGIYEPIVLGRPCLLRYSVEMDAAWEVLEQFESWSMKYDPEEKLVTVCLMHDESRHYDQAKEAPLAICLAALRAKGISHP